MTLTGTQTLNDIAKHQMQTFTDEEALSYHKNYKNVIECLQTDDWLMPFICQYDQRNNMPTFEEAMWYGNIKGMIQTNNLFMALIRTDSWAESDKNQEENFNILRNAGFDIDSADNNSDGSFYCSGLSVTQLYMTDELTPKNPPKKFFSGSGDVEFGTQSISKTAYYLQCNRPLLRLPYNPNISYLKPCAALFVNYRQLDDLFPF